MQPQPLAQWDLYTQCPSQPLRTCSSLGASCASTIGCSTGHSSSVASGASTSSASYGARDPIGLSAAYISSSRERGRGRERRPSRLVSKVLQQRRLLLPPDGQQNCNSLRRTDHLTATGTQTSGLRIWRGTPTAAPVLAAATQQGGQPWRGMTSSRFIRLDSTSSGNTGAVPLSRITACSHSRSKVTAHGVEGPSGFWQGKQRRPGWRRGEVAVNTTPGPAGSGGAVADRDGTGNENRQLTGAATPSPSAAGNLGSPDTRRGANDSIRKAGDEEEEAEEYSYVFPDPEWVPASSGPDTAQAKDGSATSPVPTPPSPPPGPQGVLAGLPPLPTLSGVLSSLAGAAQGLVSTVPPEGFILLVACSVGLATGASVVAFNDGVSLSDLLHSPL